MIEDNVNGYIDVLDHPRVFNWLDDIAKLDPNMFYTLVKDNSYYFKKIFGKPEKNNHKEWKDCWFYIYKGMYLKILSGKGGTVVLCKTITTEEDFKKDSMLGVVIISFLEELLKKLSVGY